jgi:hypothetical protein
MRLRELTDAGPVVDDDCILGCDGSYRRQVFLQGRGKLSAKAFPVLDMRCKRIDCAAGGYRSCRNACASLRVLAGTKVYLIQEKTALRQRQTHSFESGAKTDIHVMAGRICCRERSIQRSKQGHSQIIEAPSCRLNVVHARRTRSASDEIERHFCG